MENNKFFSVHKADDIPVWHRSFIFLYVVQILTKFWEFFNKVFLWLLTNCNALSWTSTICHLHFSLAWSGRPFCFCWWQLYNQMARWSHRSKVINVIIYMLHITWWILCASYPACTKICPRYSRLALVLHNVVSCNYVESANFIIFYLR